MRRSGGEFCIRRCAAELSNGWSHRHVSIERRRVARRWSERWRILTRGWLSRLIRVRWRYVWRNPSRRRLIWRDDRRSPCRRLLRCDPNFFGPPPLQPNGGGENPRHPGVDKRTGRRPPRPRLKSSKVKLRRTHPKGGKNPRECQRHGSDGPARRRLTLPEPLK